MAMRAQFQVVNDPAGWGDPFRARLTKDEIPYYPGLTAPGDYFDDLTGAIAANTINTGAADVNPYTRTHYVVNASPFRIAELDRLPVGSSAIASAEAGVSFSGVTDEKITLTWSFEGATGTPIQGIQYGAPGNDITNQIPDSTVVDTSTDITARLALAAFTKRDSTTWNLLPISSDTVGATLTNDGGDYTVRTIITDMVKAYLDNRTWAYGFTLLVLPVGYSAPVILDPSDIEAAMESLWGGTYVGSFTWQGDGGSPEKVWKVGTEELHTIEWTGLGFDTDLYITFNSGAASMISTDNLIAYEKIPAEFI